jgi:hypothetical protein
MPTSSEWAGGASRCQRKVRRRQGRRREEVRFLWAVASVGGGSAGGWEGAN